MKTTLAKLTSSQPHVKWGALAGSITITLMAMILIVLNCKRTLTGILAIDIFIAYGALIAFFLLLIGIILLLEDFIPSFTKYKEYKAKKKYVRAFNAAVKDCVRSNERKNIALFLEQYPKYRV